MKPLVKAPVIKTDDIYLRYSGPWVLRGISCAAAEGEFVGIIGPNGSGKTTLLKLLDGMLKPQRGSIELCGNSLAEMSRNSIARLVAVVPQESSFIFPFSVQEIVLMGRSPHLPMLSFEGKKDLAIASEALELTGLQDLANRSMGSLSGGERQRVLIARALAQQPRIMLLDEPTAFLDIRHQIEIFDLIRSLQEQSSLTVLAVTHDINLASIYSEKIILLNEGRIHSEGSPKEVITSENIEEVYRTRVLVDSFSDWDFPRITPVSSKWYKDLGRGHM